MKKLTVAILLALGGTAMATPVAMSQVHIRFVEASFTPGEIRFKVDSSTSQCPYGATLEWHTGNVDNAKMMLSSLLSAYLSQSPVNVIYDTATVGGGDVCYISQVGVGTP